MLQLEISEDSLSWNRELHDDGIANFGGDWNVELGNSAETVKLFSW